MSANNQNLPSRPTTTPALKSVSFGGIGNSVSLAVLPKSALNEPSKQPSVRFVFKSTAREVTSPNFQKSYAQVASSVAHHVAQTVRHGGSHHSAGHSPRPQQSERSCTHGLRLRPGELALIKQKAEAHRMNVNAFIRAKALGEDYVERPPEWMRDTLLLLYRELAGQGNNLNQLARKVNMELASAEDALGLVDQHRQPVFRALERLELALAGRRPPDDY